MRKTLLALVLTVTACNLALGAYAAVCESSSGNRYCGTSCTAQADGGCSCSGECTADEKKWRDKPGGGDDEEIIVE